MPRMDCTGPAGFGPGLGRGAGSGNRQRGNAGLRRQGCGFGYGRGMGFCRNTPQTNREVLLAQKENLQARLSDIEEQLQNR